MEEKKKCCFPEGITIKPDGENELDPCVYVTKKILKNVTVVILECENCGHTEIEWIQQPETEELTEEEFDEQYSW